MSSSHTTVQLINLPAAAQHLILDNLNLKELLNLRLVNRLISSWVSQDYLTSRLNSIEVQLLNVRTLNRFLLETSNLPFTRFYFGFSPKLNAQDMSTKFDQKVDYDYNVMNNFCLKFGSRVKYLRVYEMHMCSTKGELAFYESLTSLRSLKLNRTHRELRDSKDEHIFNLIMKSTGIPFGNVLSSLEELIFSESCEFYAYNFISLCPNLRKLQPGASCTFVGSDFDYINQRVQKLTEYIRERLRTSDKVDLEISFLDVFTVDNINLITKDNLQDFLNGVNSAGVRLSNVCGRFFDRMEKHCVDRNLIEGVSRNIVSVYGLPRVIYECPIVKEINVALEVKLTPEVEPAKDNQIIMLRMPAAVEFHAVNYKPEWGSLREIKVKIVPANLSTRGVVDPRPPNPLRVLQVSTQDANLVSGFLLGTVSNSNRNQVEKINFSLAEETTGVFVTPEDVAGHFPKLNHLQLEVHTFSSTDYTQLFRLLGKETNITCVRLKTDIQFTDETFMGTAEDVIPPFATLKHLEVFELVSVGLAVRSDITDRFFTEVLQGMSFHVFHIWLVHYVTITQEGESALLNGPFAKSIRSFECYNLVEMRNNLLPLLGPLRFLNDACKDNCKHLKPKYRVDISRSTYPGTIIESLNI